MGLFGKKDAKKAEVKIERLEKNNLDKVIGGAGTTGETAQPTPPPAPAEGSINTSRSNIKTS